MKVLHTYLQSDDQGPSGVLSVMQDEKCNLVFQLQSFRGPAGACTIPLKDVATFVRAAQSALKTADDDATTQLAKEVADVQA